jgi:ABC-type lipoprotein release transport system permease subunit
VRLVISLLFEVTARDRLVFAAVSVVMLAVALLACYLPARKASVVNPLLLLKVSAWDED